MSYSILLFDLDDTLLDFKEIETSALRRLFEQHGYVFSDGLWQVYNTVNKGLWQEYESGSLSLNKVLNTRFSETMSKFNVAVDGALWERQYRQLLGEGHQRISGALETCQKLSQSYRLFIITNGIRETQIKRLKMSGLYPLFEEIFDSESVGYQKPSKDFFEFVVKHIDNFDMGSALIIGDSLSTDIKGGRQFGIDTCWFNRHAKSNTSEIQATYTIAELTQLFDICG